MCKPISHDALRYVTHAHVHMYNLPDDVFTFALGSVPLGHADPSSNKSLLCYLSAS